MISIRIKKDMEKLDELERNLPKRLRATMSDLADDIVQDVKESISTPYPPASRWGEPPHKRTGKLRDSVVTRQARTSAGRFDVGYEVEVGMYYAGYLEPVPDYIGNAGNGAGVLYRPFLMPAVERASTRVFAYAMRHKVGRT